MSDVLVVVKVQGEYSDRSEDCVCWFPTQVTAQEFITKATGQSRLAAERWSAFEDERNFDTSEKDLEDFKVGLIDHTFSPADYGARDVSYYAAQVPRGALGA